MQTEMTAHEILVAARAKIADEKNWLVSGPTRDTNGKRVYSDDPTARKFSVDGAVNSIEYLSVEASGAMCEISLSARDLYGVGIDEVSRTVGHAAILKCFDHAIERTKQSEGGVR